MNEVLRAEIVLFLLFIMATLGAAVILAFIMAIITTIIDLIQELNWEKKNET